MQKTRTSHSAERIPSVGSEICDATLDPVLITKARQLTSEVYLKRKFITPADIDSEGTIKPESDPYMDQSVYYVMTTPDRQKVAATVRTIKYDSEKGESSFPIFDHKEALYGDSLREIEELGVENLLEISALVRNKELDKDGTAALRLYKKLFLDAWTTDTSGNSTFIMACNPVLFETFRMLFDGSMKRIGPDLPYPGQEAVPAMFSNREGAVNIINMSRDKKNPYRGVQRKVVEYFLAGSDASKIHPDVIQTLTDNQYDELLQKMWSGDWGNLDDIDQSISREIKKAAVIGKTRELGKKFKPEIVAGAGLLGYTALRTFIVGEGIDPVSDVSWEAFLAIEVFTTPPYVLGAGDLARGAGKEKSEYSTKRKLGAFAAASSAFVAPYAYLAANGAGGSEQGIAASAGIVGLAAVPPVAKQVKKFKNKRKLKKAK